MTCSGDLPHRGAKMVLSLVFFGMP